MAPESEPYRPDAPVVAELAAGAVILDGIGPRARVLLLHLRDEDRWCLPKGHVDPGETLAETARREVREETGLAALELAGELAEVSYRFYRPRDRRNVQKTTVYFLAYTSERAVRTERIFDRSEWSTLADALARVTYETDRQVLRAAQGRTKPAA